MSKTANRKPRVLILHHIEPMWEACFNREDFLKTVVTHIRRARYDKVILATLEGCQDSVYPELEGLYTELVDWSYAWEDSPETSAEQFDMPVEDFIEVSSPHQVAYLYPWIKDLKHYQVSVCGGHRWECLLDLEESLQHLNIDYRRIERCIYG